MEHNDHMFHPSSKDRLETQDRYRELKPKELLINLGLRAGDRVIDLGSGTGFFAIAAASIVGKEGSVRAVDIQPEMVSELEKRMREAGCSNIGVTTADIRESGLPDGAGDVAIIAFVIHEVEDKAALLKEAFRLIGPGGKIFVIDFDRKHHPDPDLDHGPPFEIRVDPKDLAGFAAQAGLRISKEAEVSPDVYAAVVEKP